MMRPRLVSSVKRHEGFVPEVYTCPAGYPTIGYGTRINEIELEESTAEKWLVRELEEKHERLVGVFGFAEMDTVRQDVILEMCYQLGVGGCLRFKNMWAAIRVQDFERAADEMLDSRWAREQTPERARKLAAKMRSGVWT